MRRWLLFTVILVSATCSFAQSSRKCDTNLLLITSKRVGKLSQREIGDFLMTFGKECRTNVEFSEWSNELLFSVLDNHTETTLLVLYKKERRLDMDEIMSDLASPIQDGIDLAAIISKVEKTNPVNPMKNRVLEALQVAQSNN